MSPRKKEPVPKVSFACPQCQKTSSIPMAPQHGLNLKWVICKHCKWSGHVRITEGGTWAEPRW